MNRQIKKCLQELNKQSYLNLSTFGNVVTPVLFKKDSMCLRLEDEVISIFLPVSSNGRAYDKIYRLLSELAGILQKLEKENLIYVCSNGSDKELIWYEPFLASESKGCIDDDKLKDKPGGKIILEGVKITNPYLYNSLRRYLGGIVIPTSGLDTLVSHRYLLESDYNNWKALLLSRISVWVAIGSIVGATFFNNCFGYSSINDEQYEGIIKNIHISDSLKMKELELMDSVIKVLKHKDNGRQIKTIPRK